jgi:hypothetical protein
VLDGTDGACVARCALPPGLAWHALVASDGGAHLLALGAPLSDEDDEEAVHPPATAGALLALTSAPGGHTLTLVRSCALPGALTATLSSAAQVVYVARDGALFALPDDAPAPEPAEKEGLHLPNPFRARAARSSEALPLAQAEPLALGTAFEAGADVRGACMRGARGAAWTADELKVAPSLRERKRVLIGRQRCSSSARTACRAPRSRSRACTPCSGSTTTRSASPPPYRLPLPRASPY